METWIDIPDANLEIGKPTRSIDGLALRDNPIAIAEGAAGAPRVQTGALEQTGGSQAVTQATIRDAAVGQAQLKTALWAASTTNVLLVTSTAGEYAFRAMLKQSGDVTDAAWALNDTINSYIFSAASASYTRRYNIIATGGVGRTVYVQERYVTASPPYAPYRAGDEVPLFVFALIDKTTGAIIGTSTAIDPPWANNGPTVINPLGRIAKLVREKISLRLSDLQATPSKAPAFEQELADLYGFMRDPDNAATIGKATTQPIEQAEKNADMPLIPHPFAGNDMTQYQVVIVSPTDARLCRALAARHEYLGDSVADILHGDYLILDSAPMPELQTPPGVLAVNARWRLTR